MQTGTTFQKGRQENVKKKKGKLALQGRKGGGGGLKTRQNAQKESQKPMEKGRRTKKVQKGAGFKRADGGGENRRK